MKMITKENKIFSKGLVVLLLITSSLTMMAKQPKEFSVYAGGGTSFFYYKPMLLDSVYGTSSKGMGGDLGVSFTGFVSDYVGFHVGLGFGLYNVQAKVDSLFGITHGLRDWEANPNEVYGIDLYSGWYNYEEKYKMFFLSIPVMVQFQSRHENSWRRKSSLEAGFYAMTGIKMNILLNSQYDAKVGKLENKAHFLDLDNWANTQEFAGLGRFKGNKAQGQLGYILPVYVLETGVKWYLSNDLVLYTGAYFEYALNDPTKEDRKAADDYFTQESFDALKKTRTIPEFSPLKFSDNMHLMSLGLKLRLTFIKTSNPLACPQFSR